MDTMALADVLGMAMRYFRALADDHPELPYEQKGHRTKPTPLGQYLTR
jgi:hypothetical protein